jgi:multicomponent Na+:H+ antiporter subunit E
MKTFWSAALASFALYLWLTAGSGEIAGQWAFSELVMGGALALLTGVFTARHVSQGASGKILNPLRWLIGIAYVIGPFLVEMAKANIDVAYRVITGRIRPGIIRVKSGMQNDTGLLFLANSITLTPGTLTVSVDEATNDLFIHKIHLDEGDETKESFEARELFTLNCPAWIRRIAE